MVLRKEFWGFSIPKYWAQAFGRIKEYGVVFRLVRRGCGFEYVC